MRASSARILNQQLEELYDQCEILAEINDNRLLFFCLFFFSFFLSLSFLTILTVYDNGRKAHASPNGMKTVTPPG